MESDGLFLDQFFGLFVLQATLALGAGLAASLALRKHPARAHRAMILALVAVVAIPVATLVARELGFGFLPPQAEISASLSTHAPARFSGIAERKDLLQGIAPDSAEQGPSSESIPPEVETGVAWQRILQWSWAAGSVVAILYFAASFLGGLRILRSARLVVETAYTEGAREASEKLGLGVTPTIFASAEVRSPSVWCWRVHPALLVPPVEAGEKHDTDWSTLFTHELAHYVRRDHLADLLSALALVLLPWHPLAWWARNRLALLGEDACDDWALTTNGADAAGYAESLLHVAIQRRPAFVQAAASNKGHLLRRIRRITSSETGFRPRVGRMWSVCASLMVVCAVAVVALAQPSAATANNPESGVAALPAEADAGTAMQRALQLGKTLSDQRNDEKAVATIRKELEALVSELNVGSNLLENGDVERGDGQLPDAWALRKEKLISFEWSGGTGFDGSRGVKITKKEGKFPYATFLQTVPAPRDDRLVRLSARIKTAQVGKAVLDLVFLDDKDEWVYHIWVHTIGDPWGSGTHDWKEYVGYAYVPSGTKKIEVSAQMYWPGELWLDDIELREVKP